MARIKLVLPLRQRSAKEGGPYNSKVVGKSPKTWGYSVDQSGRLGKLEHLWSEERGLFRDSHNWVAEDKHKHLFRTEVSYGGFHVSTGLIITTSFIVSNILKSSSCNRCVCKSFHSVFGFSACVILAAIYSHSLEGVDGLYTLPKNEYSTTAEEA